MTWLEIVCYVYVSFLMTVKSNSEEHRAQRTDCACRHPIDSSVSPPHSFCQTERTRHLRMSVWVRWPPFRHGMRLLSSTRRSFVDRLEALSVHDLRSRLVVLLLGDPHLLESGQRGQDRSSDPHGVLSLRRCDDLNLHRLRSKSLDLLLHSVVNSLEHGSTSRKDDISIQILTDIHIALHDGVISGLVDTRELATDQVGLEENFRASESLVSDGDHLSIGQLIVLLELSGLLSAVHLILEVQSHIGQLLPISIIISS